MRNDLVTLDLYGGGNGLVMIDDLPISDKDKQALRTVQGMDERLSKYLLETHGAHNLVEIKDLPDTFKGLDGCRGELRCGQVFNPDKSRRHFSGTGYGDNYLKDKRDNYLPRVIAFTYERLSNPEYYYNYVKDNAKEFEVHHTDPTQRTTARGNGILNIRLLPKGLHRQITRITRDLRHIQEDENSVEIKPIFYQSFLDLPVADNPLV